MALILETADAIEAWVEKEIAVTDWVCVTQEHIQQFLFVCSRVRPH